jgi:hypothetical protein
MVEHLKLGQGSGRNAIHFVQVGAFRERRGCSLPLRSMTGLDKIGFHRSYTSREAQVLAGSERNDTPLSSEPCHERAKMILSRLLKKPSPARASSPKSSSTASPMAANQRDKDELAHAVARVNQLAASLAAMQARLDRVGARLDTTAADRPSTVLRSY